MVRLPTDPSLWQNDGMTIQQWQIFENVLVSVPPE